MPELYLKLWCRCCQHLTGNRRCSVAPGQHRFLNRGRSPSSLFMTEVASPLNVR